MEGSSAPKGAATPPLDPKVVNGGNGNPMTDVPTPGADEATQAATSPPPQSAPTGHPVEQALMAEMQDTKNEVRKLMASNRIMALALFCIGLACIYYLLTKLKAKLPEGTQVPAPKVEGI